jgi:hypothetical protein
MQTLILSILIIGIFARAQGIILSGGLILMAAHGAYQMPYLTVLMYA